MATQGEKSMLSTRVAVEFKGKKHKWINQVMRFDDQARMAVAIGLEYKCKNN